MRKKYVDQVYMKEVLAKEWYVEKCDEINGYIALKYIKEMTEPISWFCNGKKYIGVDKGYSILEYICPDRDYNCRVFFDNLDRPMLFYFDINNGSGIENNIPWYDDLFLDVLMECPIVTDTGYYIRLDDFNEFKAAFKEGVFDKETYDQKFNAAVELMTELRERKNDIFNRCQHDLYRIKTQLNLKI